MFKYILNLGSDHHFPMMQFLLVFSEPPPPKKRKWTQPSGKKDAAANFRAFFHLKSMPAKIVMGLGLGNFPPYNCVIILLLFCRVVISSIISM
jgi:hypothetical protein